MPVLPLKRVPTGIKGLDALMEGGLVHRSNILVRGSTGTGKTLLSLHYLYAGAARYNEPGIFLSFSESQEALYTHGTLMGWDFQKLEEENKFTFVRFSPHEVENIIREGGGTIRDSIEEIGAKRLVIDSLTAYSLLFENPYKADESTLNLFDILHKWGCTSLLTSEAPATPEEGSFERLGFLTDGIINLYYLRQKDRRCRALEVLKMRDTGHSDKIHGFVIGKGGRMQVTDRCAAFR